MEHTTMIQMMIKVQIATLIFIATCLFLAAEDLSSFHSKTVTVTAELNVQGQLYVDLGSQFVGQKFRVKVKFSSEMLNQKSIVKAMASVHA